MSQTIDAPDAEAQNDDERQYGHGPLSKEELDLKYPNRPHNHSKTPPFHELFTTLFNPLNENRKKPTGPAVARVRQGRHGPVNPSPHEQRRIIIERFISRWRHEVGDDFYPAMRLIIPEKDRDRGLYGLKEKTIGKLFVKLMKIDKNSEDGYNLVNWKLPSHTIASHVAGDFAGRCYEVLSRRPMRTGVGDMRIAEVNELLDRLSTASKEENQLPIFETFYNRMNAEELLWLVRIILRQMKVGATEKTFLALWHPDGEVLFNVSSNLRRVCWELTDPSIRLEADEAGVTLMECFQPQLAQFQMHSFQKMVDNMRPTEQDPEYWIEEKLDGERMQLHMIDDKDFYGGKRFGFWSRKAKDYTHLYGKGFYDENSALSQHLKDAFDPLVRNIILDGEMITWDPELDKMVPFGTLKTAALAEQRNPFQGTGHRPLFRVFDILYLNDEPLTRYTLRDRRRALERCVRDVHRRLEIHTYEKAYTVEAIDPLLRKVVAEASEGLVLKNPRSMYRLNSRNDDWMKVKPEYMADFGESLDVLVIGGSYGSGRRGGILSSFLCGLRVDPIQIRQGANPMKCYSFFNVGGGFRSEDYASIRHHTEGKWIDWDSKNPPTEFIELSGGDLQYERPDVWIKPCDSVVISVKAASVVVSDQFRMGFSLRFPRFKRLRVDRAWDSALSIQEFSELKARMEEESKDREFKLDTRRRITKRLKRSIVIAGNAPDLQIPLPGPESLTFDGLNFCILSEGLRPIKKSKAELERLVKTNGGKIFQSPAAADDMICITDKKVVKAASLMKSGTTNLVRPAWILDALYQSKIDEGKSTLLLPFEARHMFFTTVADEEQINEHADQFGDSYARDVSVDELKHILEGMDSGYDDGFDAQQFMAELLHYNDCDVAEIRGWLFSGVRAFIDSGLDGPEGAGDISSHLSAAVLRMRLAGNLIRFAGGNVVTDWNDDGVTHVVVDAMSPKLGLLRREISTQRHLPRMVTAGWIEESWHEGTLLDEERYAPIGQ